MKTIEIKELEAAQNATSDSVKAAINADRAVASYYAAINADIGVQDARKAARVATNAALKAALDAALDAA